MPLLRQLITIKLREGNVINGNYKYVDGTSFASRSLPRLWRACWKPISGLRRNK